MLESTDRILNVEELRALQKANIERALDSCGWRIAGADGAARLLGISESTLRSQMKPETPGDQSRLASSANTRMIFD